ncbi:MAG TPA: tetratricopeptide repeat protein [Gemmatimonadales bacterium]
MAMPYALMLALLLQGPLPAGPTQDAAREQLTQAEARYRAAIAITPGIGAYHESLALVLERQGRWEEALAAHREAVRLDPQAPRSHEGLAAVLQRMGRTDEAIRELQEAVRLDPNSPELQAKLDSLTARETEVAGDGYHDYSGFADDHQASWTVRRAMELTFATVLGVSAFVLLAPLAGALLLGLVQLPRQWLRGTLT